MKTILTFAAATMLGVFSTQILHAATFTYDGVVTISEGPAVTPDDPDLPPLGDNGELPDLPDLPPLEGGGELPDLPDLPDLPELPDLPDLPDINP